MENAHRCAFCNMVLYPHEFKTHNCRQMPQSSRAYRTPENPATGRVFSVIRHTSDILKNVPNVITNEYLGRSCYIALERIQSRIKALLQPGILPTIQDMRRQIHAGPSTSSSPGGSAETGTHETPRVSTTPFNPLAYRPNVAENLNKPSSLGDRGGKYSVTSQTSNVLQVNSEEAGTSGSNLNAGECAEEPPGSATGERAVQHLLERYATEMARMRLEMRGQTTSSSPLGNASTQQTESANVRPPMASTSLHAFQENLEQAATSGSELVTERLAGEFPGSSEGACASSTQWNIQYPLSNDHLKEFYCKLCRLYYTSYEALDSHILTLIENGTPHAMAHDHSPFFRRPGFFVCQTCQLHFDTKSELGAHWSVHAVPTPYQCILCGTNYQIEECLSNHERKRHAKKRIFKCMRCYKRFLSETCHRIHRCDP